MAHFACIENNIVVRVIVVDDKDCSGGHFPESDISGALFCAQLFGGAWKQTSYNHNFRKQFAGLNYLYDANADVFINPKPFPSWSLDENYDWQPPTPMPDSGQWVWDETNKQWVTV